MTDEFLHTFTTPPKENSEKTADVAGEESSNEDQDHEEEEEEEGEYGEEIKLNFLESPLKQKEKASSSFYSGKDKNTASRTYESLNSPEKHSNSE